MFCHVLAVYDSSSLISVMSSCVSLHSIIRAFLVEEQKIVKKVGGEFSQPLNEIGDVYLIN